ncbi:hypothetical protein K492DRAFT_183494 [Lichtheimia hyalospora FSU 10163]|nr:hypothetical protein K492DRAFT_183494 [Lichtheimia hyalospora FSU 10163]
MTLSNLQELGLSPTIVATNRDAATTITLSTRQIRQCIDTKDIHQLSSLLEKRSRALALCAAFDTALRDATVIQSLKKSWTIGYQCAGDVYVRQGRHVAAVKEYTKGLANLTVPDPQLERSICIAKEALNKKMDPIGLLPEEVVVTNVIPRLMGSESLHSSEPCPYLYVSRVWRDRILQSDCLSFRLSTSVQEGTDNDQEQHTELIRFAPFIRLLYVEQESNDNPYFILARATFQNLRKLYIQGKWICMDKHSMVTHDNEKYVQDFESLSILPMLGNGLTHLDIDIHFKTIYINLESIMQACPKLISCRVGASALLNTSSLGNYVYPKMIHFEIRNRHITLSQKNFEAIFKAFPSLIKLSANHGKDTRSLSLIHRYCPQIKWIEYNDAPFACNTRPSARYQDVIILRSYIKFYTDDVVSVVGAHADTLEYFDFIGTLDGDMQTKTPVHFPRLVYFGFYGRKHYDVRFSNWLLLNSPNLEHVRLRASGIHTETLDSLRSLHHLTRLVMCFSPSPSQENYHQALERLLQHHIDLGNTSTLESLSLYSVPPPQDDTTLPTSSSWLFLIARLSCIRSLMLHMKFDMDTRFVAFMKTLSQTCHALESINLYCFDNSMAHGVISPLQHLQKLKSLEIYAKTLSEQDLLDLQYCPALKFLSLCTNTLSQNTQRTLLASIEKVITKVATISIFRY